MPTNHKRQNAAPRGSANELSAAPDQPVTTAEAPVPTPAPAAPVPPTPAAAPAATSGGGDGQVAAAPPPPQQQQGRPPQHGQQGQGRRGEGLNIGELKEMSIQKLTQIAKELNVAGATGMRKQELIFQILKAQTELSGFIFSEGVLGKRVDGGCAGCHLTPPEIAKEPRNQLSGKAGEWFKRWPSEWPKRLVLRFNHESKDHLKTRCTECHNNLKQMNTLDVHKADVGIRQCEECHAIRPNIQVGKDKVSISDEMDCKADPKCEQNPEPGDQYICVACHTSVIGREQPPCSHYDVIGQTCPKPEL